MQPDQEEERQAARDQMAVRQRAVDEKFMEIDDKVTDLQTAVDKNTEITEQIRDILNSFKVIGAIAKWLTAVGGALVAGYHGWQKMTGR